MARSGANEIADERDLCRRELSVRWVQARRGNGAFLMRSELQRSNSAEIKDDGAPGTDIDQATLCTVPL